jgi:uncharacterized protein DUF4350
MSTPTLDRARETTDVVVGVTPRSLWRTARAPIVVGAVVLVIAVLVVALGGAAVDATLDPDGTNDTGAHAIAQLLRNHGVTVERVSDPLRAVAHADAKTTILITVPSELDARTEHAIADSAADVVALSPQSSQLRSLGAGAIGVAGIDAVTDRPPSCALDYANRAGDAVVGGVEYAAGAHVTTCYPSDGRAALAAARVGDHTVTVIGSAGFLTNRRLANSGNAALALGLLGAHARLMWIVPGSQSDVAGQQSLLDLLPRSVVLAVVQLLLAVVIVGIWRGRRLGRLVPEPLPVVVRAAETVEGRARLYRAAKAHTRAAHALREATLERLRPVLGLARDSDSATVVDAIAARTGALPAEVTALLYGAAPADDAALVTLADELDQLESEVRRS